MTRQMLQSLARWRSLVGRRFVRSKSGSDSKYFSLKRAMNGSALTKSKSASSSLPESGAVSPVPRTVLLIAGLFKTAFTASATSWIKVSSVCVLMLSPLIQRMDVQEAADHFSLASATGRSFIFSSTARSTSWLMIGLIRRTRGSGFARISRLHSLPRVQRQIQGRRARQQLSTPPLQLPFTRWCISLAADCG